MNITIRKMSIRDYEEVVALWAGIPGLGVHLAEADSRESIKYYLKRNPGLSFVARHRGRLIGTVLCGQDGRRGVIYHLAVAPKYRFHGIGRKLVDHCLKALAKVGIDKCYIFVFSKNTKGKQFWKKIGWSRYEGLDSMCRFIKPSPVIHKCFVKKSQKCHSERSERSERSAVEESVLIDCPSGLSASLRVSTSP